MHTTAPEQHRSNTAPLSVEAFLQKAAARQLVISLNTSGNGLLFHGPKGAVSDRVRDYMQFTKPAIVGYLQAKEAEHRASLLAEFPAVGESGYDQVVEEGIAVEADLRKQQDAADAAGYDDYGDRLHCTHQAATAGRIARAVVVLSPGRETNNPGFQLLQLVRSAKLQQKATGDVWRDTADGKRIESDIRAITDWYAPPI